MRRYWLGLAAASALSACGGGNPFTAADETSTDGGTDSGGAITREGIPPGTASPTPAEGIFRSEPTEADGGERGDGFATAISYDSATDTFSVDNLGFDGDNAYGRGTNVSSLGPYAVYEAKAQLPDIIDSQPINQFTHRAIYGVSTSGNTEFAIVRTGSYVDYGFGGFIYQRNNGVTLPSSGQALYTGTMAGIRDFDGAGGLQYTTADVQVAIDFEDFNDTTGTRGDAVRGYFDNRVIYDIDGNDITASVISGIEADKGTDLNDQLPALVFDVGPGVMDNNGEILGTLKSYYADSNGATQVLESGKYYAVVSGDNAEEIVGVISVSNSFGSGVTARETGGFIVYNPDS